VTEVQDGTARGLAAAGGPLIQLRVADGRAMAQAVTALEPREIPVLATFDEPWPAGRDQVIGEVAAELAATLSVQLYGAPGVGKKAIARAVIRRLAAGPNPVRGVELWPAGGQPHTLGRLYERLAHLFFAGTTFQPPEPRLRAAAAAAGLTAVVVIGDCDLPSRDVARLLGTFPDCTFLLTSGHRTLFSSGVAHEVGPLSLDAAVELIAHQTSQHPAALARLQVAQAYNLAAGQTGRLLQHAAFLRLTGGQSELVAPPEQAAALAAGLSEPAAEVLAALATFGTDLAPDLLGAVTGRPGRPPGGPALARAGAELRACALVTLAGAADGGAAYRITPDALAAVAALGRAPASARTAGRGLLQRLSWRDRAQPPPGPALLLAVAGRLHADGADHEAAALIRAALPGVLGAGYVQDWLDLLRLGLAAAGAAGASADLEYFAGEEATRRRLTGEQPTAAAAVAAAAVAAAAASGGRPVTRRVTGYPAGPGGGPGRPPRRFGTRILLAGYGIPLIVIVVVLAAAGVLAVRSPGRPGALAPAAGRSAGARAVPAPSGVPGTPGRSRVRRGQARPALSHPGPSASPARPSPGHSRPPASSASPRSSASPSARPSASPSASPAPTTPAAVVQAYFAAINARQYQRAWQLGGHNLTPGYAQFVAGFAGTSSDTVQVGPASGSVVGVLLTAVQADGTTKFYSGTYTVSAGEITGSDMEETG
jgi:hypothetical protein